MCSHFSGRRPSSAIAVLAAAALALTGCGLSGGDDQDSDTGGDDTLTVWFPGNSEAEIALMTETLIPVFEEEHGVEVDVTYIDWADMSPRLNTAFAGNAAPDVFGHGPAAAADFVINERVDELSDRVAELPPEDIEDLGSNLDYGRVYGGQYLMPLAIQGQLIAFREDFFEEADLDPQAPPTTWTDVRAAAEKLTQRDASGNITRSGLLLGTAALARQQSFMALLSSNGGTLIDEDTLEARFDSPEGAEALDFFTGLYQGPAAVAGDLGNNYQTAPPAQQPLVTGTAAMTLLSANAIQQIVDTNPELPIGIMQPPGFEQARAYGGPVSGLFINSDSNNKDLSWEFIKYMITREVNDTYVDTTGAIPLRASAAESEYVKQSFVIQASLAASDTYVPNPNVPGWTQIRDELDVQIERALNGQISSEEALTAAAEAANAILSEAPDGPDGE